MMDSDEYRRVIAGLRAISIGIAVVIFLLGLLLAR